jgi:hypothetical protein
VCGSPPRRTHKAFPPPPVFISPRLEDIDLTISHRLDRIDAFPQPLDVRRSNPNRCFISYAQHAFRSISLHFASLHPFRFISLHSASFCFISLHFSPFRIFNFARTPHLQYIPPRLQPHASPHAAAAATTTTTTTATAAATATATTTATIPPPLPLRVLLVAAAVAALRITACGGGGRCRRAGEGGAEGGAGGDGARGPGGEEGRDRLRAGRRRRRERAVTASRCKIRCAATYLFILNKHLIHPAAPRVETAHS